MAIYNYRGSTEWNAKKIGQLPAATADNDAEGREDRFAAADPGVRKKLQKCVMEIHMQ